jgi:hypothetical protein
MVRRRPTPLIQGWAFSFAHFECLNWMMFREWVLRCYAARKLIWSGPVPGVQPALAPALTDAHRLPRLSAGTHSLTFNTDPSLSHQQQHLSEQPLSTRRRWRGPAFRNLGGSANLRRLIHVFRQALHVLRFPLFTLQAIRVVMEGPVTLHAVTTK